MGQRPILMMAGVHWPLGDQGQAGPSVGLVGKERGAPKTAEWLQGEPPHPRSITCEARRDVCLV